MNDVWVCQQVQISRRRDNLNFGHHQVVAALEPIAGKVAGKNGLSKVKAEKIIDTILEEILPALRDGEKVRLVGFGNFIVRKRKGRIGRNPQTGGAMTIGETKRPAFISGVNLTKAVRYSEGKAIIPKVLQSEP